MRKNVPLPKGFVEFRADVVKVWAIVKLGSHERPRILYLSLVWRKKKKKLAKREVQKRVGGKGLNWWMRGEGSSIFVPDSAHTGELEGSKGKTLHRANRVRICPPLYSQHGVHARFTEGFIVLSEIARCKGGGFSEFNCRRILFNSLPLSLLF